MSNKALVERVEKDNVKFVSLQFTDVTGAVKSVDIPRDGLEKALEEGIWFDGSSVEGFTRIQESDMRLVIDPETYAILPWSPEERRRARFFCDIYRPDGNPFEGDPRGALRRMMEKTAKKGWTFNAGAEPEFFLFKPNGPETTHPVPHDVGGYFDFSAVDEAVRVRTEIMDAVTMMGLEVEMGHHEVALGQHEIDFRYNNGLTAADQVVTLKYAVKAIAAKHGLVASFMPKPIFGENGSGMHVHQSFTNEKGDSLFYDENADSYLSDLGRGFIAGQLAHAASMIAVLAPIVNSYKRLVPGYEAPVYIGWAQVNRSALIRIPHITPERANSARAELRCPDPAANPYLAFAVMLAAGLDGIEKKMTCPEPLNDLNVYELTKEDREKKGIGELAGSLGQAMREMEKGTIVEEALGSFLYEVFQRAKWAEWEEYITTVTDWEVKQYLETA